MRGDDAGMAAAEEQAAAALREARARRDSSCEALADLEMDRVAGKVSDEDHARLKPMHQADALRALRDLEALGDRSDGPAGNTSST